MLIAVGSALLTDISVQVGVRYAQGSAAWDPGRIAAQIVTGVGFLGAGTIIQSRGAVHGLTTAAGLWVASAIGIATGAGFYAEAVLTSLVLLLILTVLRPVEALLHGGMQHIVLHIGREQKLSRLLEILEEAEIRTEKISVAQDDAGASLQVRFRGSPEDVQRLIRLAGREEFAASAAEDEMAPRRRKWLL
jgi:putative Mg2+ transporter-C (MgtC) family protein